MECSVTPCDISKGGYIFISYAHKDSELVFKIIEALHKKSYRIWYDGGISVSENWTDEIANAIMGCSAFVVFLTRESAASDYVREEIMFALEQKAKIIPVYAEENIKLTPGLHMRLQQIQGIMSVTPLDIENKLCLAIAKLNLPTGFGKLYIDSGKGKHEYKQALSWYQKAAEQGFCRAQNDLGARYEKGSGVEKDYATAVYWYQKAAEQGYAEAQNNLGWCLSKGRGIKLDYTRAIYWFQRAIEQEHIAAMYNLGVCYEKGQGVTIDYERAFYWYTKAAKHGHAAAQSSLGYYYDKGLGVEQDFANVVYWYTKAAEQGYAEAQNNLGWRCEKGKGIKQDLAQAIYWYTKAAEQGNTVAQNNLEALL